MANPNVAQRHDINRYPALPSTVTQVTALTGALANIGVAVLSGATAGAYTLAAPSNDGDDLKITSSTAAAHVVTATSLINDGVAGQPHTTLTFVAFAGASIHLIAFGGLWNVVAKNLVTIT